MSSQGAFSQLPPEVLNLIVRDLSVPELKTFRCLTRLSRSVVDPVLFSAVTFSLQPRHKEQFFAICHHPHLRFYVKTLNYSITSFQFQNKEVLADLLDASDWEGNNAERDMLCLSLDALSDAIRNTPIRHVIDMLWFGFTAMPNLRSIAFVQDLVGRSGWFLQHPWLATAYQFSSAVEAGPSKRTATLSMFCARNWREGRLLSPWQGCVLGRYYWDIIKNELQWTDVYAVVYAVKLSDAKIQSFSVCQTFHDGTDHLWLKPESIAIWARDKSDYIVPCQEFFRNLVKLSLSLDPPLDYRTDTFAILLNAAKSLRELNLDGGCPDPSRQECILPAFHAEGYDFLKQKALFDSPPRAATFPHLRCLSISNALVFTSRLYRFLADHKTIDSLTLRNVHSRFYTLVSYESDSEDSDIDEIDSFERELQRNCDNEADWERVLDCIKELDLKSIVLKDISGFIRVLDPTIPHPGPCPGTDIRSQASVMLTKMVWTALGISYGRVLESTMKYQQTRKDPNLSRWERERGLRYRIERDKLEMEKRITSYIKRETDVNPLVGFRMYRVTDWGNI